jgi:hypothetical protein
MGQAKVHKKHSAAARARQRNSSLIRDYGASEKEALFRMYYSSAILLDSGAIFVWDDHSSALLQHYGQFFHRHRSGQ